MRTFIDILQATVSKNSQKTAVVAEDGKLTYEQLWQRSNAVAHAVAKACEGKEEKRVLLILPRIADYLSATIGVMKAGGTFITANPAYPAGRINAIIEDAQPALVITTTTIWKERKEEINAQEPLLIEQLPSDVSDINLSTPEQEAYILFTSGTTGKPKGIVHTMASLTAFATDDICGKTADEPFNHLVVADHTFIAFIYIYQALARGGEGHILSEERRTDLMYINDYIREHQIYHTFMGSLMGDVFLASFETTLGVLNLGGERLPAIAKEHLQQVKVFNSYGMSECAPAALYLLQGDEEVVPIGKPLSDGRIYLLDENRMPVAEGELGEIAVCSCHAAKEYFHQPELTAKTFVPCPDDASKTMVMTGDRGRMDQNGNLIHCGRKDNMVKLRGMRIETGEIENRAMQMAAIRNAVCAVKKVAGEDQLCLYYDSEKSIGEENLKAFLAETLAEYMVPTYYIYMEKFELNKNGKIDRSSLPEPGNAISTETQEAVMTQEVQQTATLNVLEQQIHDILTEIMGISSIAPDTNLGLLGLTSLSAIKVAVAVQKRFKVSLDAKALVKSGTLRSIENEILTSLLSAQDGEKGNTEESTRKGGVEGTAPLTAPQQGIYFECMKNPSETIYNLPSLLRFPVGADRLAEAVTKVIAMHPVMAAHFEQQDAEIVQVIDAELALQPIVGRSTLKEAELDEYKHRFVAPFKLQNGPLYRAEVIDLGNERSALLLDVHHLVFDGGSMELFANQLCNLLDGKEPEPEMCSYMEYAQEVNEEELQAAKAFFAEQLQTCEGATEIPADIKSTKEKGETHRAECAVDWEKIETSAREMGVTAATLMLAAVDYTVARFTGAHDAYICTVSSGRSNLKIADTVGMFVNTLALASHIGDETTAEYVRKVSDSFDATMRHENYPFAQVASDHGFQPQIAYAYQRGLLSAYSVGGKAVEMESLEADAPMFKINILILDKGVVVEYDDNYYSEKIGKQLAQSIVATAMHITENRETPVKHLSIVSEEQEKELEGLRTVAKAEAPFRFFHECISHYAQTQPDHEALIGCDARFTYAEMDRVTTHIALALRQRGVKDGDRVALLLPRTSRLILSMFGVLKAGAAYIPCDPEYPEDRVKLILEDSEAKLIITPELAEELINSEVSGELYTEITPDNLAYLIYTSGSTGRPKGVMLRHEGICNYLYGHPANVFAHGVATDANRVLSVTTISFDAALQDIGMALYNGKTLIVATEEQANNPLELSKLIQEQHIDMVSGTPSRWMTWLTSDDFAKAIAQIKIARAGGEKFSDQLLEQLRGVTKARIFNCYGPTEITVASNNAELTHAERVTVGRPQLNVTEFIVDSDGNELPQGIVGELYIGGKGVARGYNNLDKMTAERFVEYHGIRIYKSGDYARWEADGNVTILGRTDNQIKLRGLRIELGEIENVMLKVEGVKKVVILIRKIGGKEHLCAYYTADREIAPDALKAEISKSLTQYMVPTAYLQLETMPMTPNGKTDVKALPEPVLAITSAYTEPANDAERTFCDIFAEILQMDRVGATDNFFELGGTSLVVTRVIIMADKAGMKVAYGDVFDNPTPRQLAALVTGVTVDETAAEGGDNVDEVIVNYDYTAIDNVLRHNVIDTFRQGECQPLGNVMITGATGFLGIHILHELLNSEAQTIYCLVRGKTLQAAEQRLRTLLFYYFDNSYSELFGNRLNVILGDVTNNLVEVCGDIQIDTIFNCAAIVKHFSKGTEIEDVNVGGARACIDYCLTKNARLVHISTASTRGLSINDTPAPEEVFTERRLYMGQFLGNKYIHSKFEAERYILEAVALHGLSAKIMRVGNLSARSTDGEFQVNFGTNSFMGRIKVYNMLGCCPHTMRTMPLEFSPINEVSKAIILLATTPKECTVFHPYNNHAQQLGDVLAELSKVTGGVEFVEQEDFDAAMDAAQADPEKARILSSMLAYQNAAHGQKTADVRRDNEYTTQVLFRLGYSWTPTSWDYVRRFLKAINGLGFFENQE